MDDIQPGMSWENVAQIIFEQIHVRRWCELTRAEQREWTNAAGLGLTAYLRELHMVVEMVPRRRPRGLVQR